MQDKSMQDLLKRLISTMKSALSESNKVVHVVEQIETHGFKVMLVVDAVIQPVEQALWTTPSSGPASDPELQLSSDDLSWLKSLHIASNPDQPSPPSPHP
jgi:hypothetical protein